MIHRSLPWRSLLLLAVALAAASASASDRSPALAEQAEPADPMAHLRARLQEKLGAIKSPEGGGPNELLVASRRPAAPASTAAPAKAARSPSGPWGYSGESGPSHWAELKPENSLCGRGRRQSPIDIRDGIAVDLAPVQFDYRPSAFSVIDNGHTVQVNLAPGNAIEVTGRRYELQQFHFHRPSEERINGRQYELSVHLVHRDPEGRSAVVAVVLERGAAQPVLQQVWNNLPLEKHEAVPAPEPLDPNTLLPDDRRYFTYMGSLTTPPCSEGVLWMVMQQPVPVSADQVGIFQRLYPMNARPVQAMAGRVIKQSR